MKTNRVKKTIPVPVPQVRTEPKPEKCPFCARTLEKCIENYEKSGACPAGALQRRVDVLEKRLDAALGLDESEPSIGDGDEEPQP